MQWSPSQTSGWYSSARRRYAFLISCLLAPGVSLSVEYGSLTAPSVYTMVTNPCPGFRLGLEPREPTLLGEDGSKESPWNELLPIVIDLLVAIIKLQQYNFFLRTIFPLGGPSDGYRRVFREKLPTLNLYRSGRFVRSSLGDRKSPPNVFRWATALVKPNAKGHETPAETETCLIHYATEYATSQLQRSAFE